MFWHLILVFVGVTALASQKRYTGLVFVGDHGNVSIQSQGGYGTWEQRKVEMIDGYNDSRFEIKGNILFYRKKGELHPVARDTDSTMVENLLEEKS